MIRHILKKDWRLLWPLVALMTAIQIGLEWSSFKSGLFGENLAAHELLYPLTLAWFACITALTVAVIHQDPIPGADQDWLIRPLSRTDLLMGKILFVLLSVSLPMLLLNLLHALALGFPPMISLQDVLFKEFYVFICLIVPVLALAASTGNMTEFITSGVVLGVVYAASTGVSAFLFGVDYCPTCDTGVSWLQHILQHAGILVGAVIVLAFQFYRRRTALSRAVLIFGAVALVVVQFPWGLAFSVQRTLQGKSGTANSLAITFDREAADLAANDPQSGGRPGSGRQAARALLRGDVGQAMELLRRRTLPGAPPVAVDLPLQISGLPRDGLLLLDRSQVHLFSGDGSNVFSAVVAMGPSQPNLIVPPETADASPQMVHQTLYLPAALYKGSAHIVRLQMDYSLTLMELRGSYRIAALDGELYQPDVGFCATKLDPAGDSIRLRCKQIGASPFCMSATLYGPDGRHNPVVLDCSPDYRPYLPPITDVGRVYGPPVPVIDSRGLIHYAVATSELEQSYLLLKIYAVREHFTRSFDVANFPLHGG